MKFQVGDLVQFKDEALEEGLYYDGDKIAIFFNKNNLTAEIIVITDLRISLNLYKHNEEFYNNLENFNTNKMCSLYSFCVKPYEIEIINNINFSF